MLLFFYLFSSSFLNFICMFLISFFYRIFQVELFISVSIFVLHIIAGRVKSSDQHFRQEAFEHEGLNRVDCDLGVGGTAFGNLAGLARGDGVGDGPGAAVALEGADSEG